jgi:uncharacterized membrane protein YhiD involved in acid resistance
VTQPALTWGSTLASLLLSLGLAMLIAWTYAATYQGLAYLREFQHTLVLAGIVATIVLLAIGNEIARGVGLVGALTLIRFRSTLKDPRDLAFAFAALGVGVASGARAYHAAVLGTAVFMAAAYYISWSSFGARSPFDAVLRLCVPSDSERQQPLRDLLRQHCRSFALVQLREAGDTRQEHVYHLRLVDAHSQPGLLRDLTAVRGVEEVSLLLHDGPLGS